MDVNQQCPCLRWNNLSSCASPACFAGRIGFTDEGPEHGLCGAWKPTGQHVDAFLRAHPEGVLRFRLASECMLLPETHSSSPQSVNCHITTCYDLTKLNRLCNVLLQLLSHKMLMINHSELRQQVRCRQSTPALTLWQQTHKY